MIPKICLLYYTTHFNSQNLLALPFITRFWRLFSFSFSFSYHATNKTVINAFKYKWIDPKGRNVVTSCNGNGLDAAEKLAFSGLALFHVEVKLEPSPFNVTVTTSLIFISAYNNAGGRPPLPKRKRSRVGALIFKASRPLTLSLFGPYCIGKLSLLLWILETIRQRYTNKKILLSWTNEDILNIIRISLKSLSSFLYLNEEGFEGNALIFP